MKNINPLSHLPLGTLVAERYEILEVVGQGGFGITYKGYDTVLDVPVALKEYFPCDIAYRNNAASQDVRVEGNEEQKLFEEGKRKFLAEARVLAKFAEDPNVVGVRDFFEYNRTVYIVMQYLEGESLKEYIEKNGQMSFDESFILLRPIMQSLSRMHAKGLIHRDISPSNMIRMRGGKIKLIDFGTAKEISANGEKSLSIMLKPGYAPVEQYQKHGAQGPWTDVYALCASLYKLITGITPNNSISRILNDELKRPSEYGAVITPAQEEALMHGLAVRDSERIRDMDLLEETFEAASRPQQDKDSVQNMQIVPPAAPEANDPAGYDDERTVRGPSELAAPEADRKEERNINRKEEQNINRKEERNINRKEERKPEQEDARKSRIEPGQEETQKASRKPERRPEHKESHKRTRKPERKTAQKAAKKDKVSRQPSPVRKILPAVLVAILAAAAVAGIFYFRSHGTAGGEIYHYSDGARVILKAEGGEPLTITKGMLDELDRNEQVVKLRFFQCILSDDIITRLADMKRIEDIEFERCKGFSTLNPLAGLQTLRTMSLYPPSETDSETGEKAESIFDASDLFTADIPQVTNLSMHRYTAKDGFSFLGHFPGLEKISVNDFVLSGNAGTFPTLPELTKCEIIYTDISDVDLTALGESTKIKELTMNFDNLETLTFLEKASSLESVQVSNNQITSLDGLQDKASLLRVTADRNMITDISALGSCPNLYYLSADDNQISDITAFASCPGLYGISLNRNQITDISPLAGCAELKALYLQKNQIADASVLSNCPKLLYLYLNGNQISDLSSVSVCGEMIQLDISRNAISDLKFCEQMLNLEVLKASENQIGALDGLENVTQLERVHLDNNQISDISLLAKNGEHLQIAVLDRNRIADLTPLQDCINLKALSVNENLLTELRAVQNCTDLAYISASGNQISDISALQNCPDLYTADLGENQITNVAALGASDATKMALLLQNNQIRDITPLYGMKDYVCLSLYNNQITDVSGMSAMTGIGSSSRLYLGWWEGLEPEILAETTYRELRLVDAPLDRQVNFLDSFKEKRKEISSTYGDIVYLTQEEADQEIAELRKDARVAAGIEEPEEEGIDQQ